MVNIPGGIRRLFVGREARIILVILIGGSVLISGFVPAYLAKLFASSVRNTYFSGTGALYYAFVLFFLYFEAVILTAIYLSLRAIYQAISQLRNRTTT